LSQQNDKTVLERLRGIATDLEDQLGVTAEPGLVNDRSITAQLQRIENTIPEIASLTALAAAIAVSSSGKTISFVIQDPENTKTHAGRGTKSFPAWLNDTGFTLTITKVVATADADDYTFLLFKSASQTDLSVANDSLLATVPCSSNGTSSFFASLTSFTVDTVETGKWIIFEHSSGTAENVSVIIEGTLS
jgi:hypothetical protein